MRHRTPLLFASCLAIAAVLLLWFRMPVPTGTPTPRPDTPALAAPAVVPGPAPRTHTPPTLALETAPAPDVGAFVVRVVGAQGPLEGARVRAYLRVADDGSGTSPWRLAGDGATTEGGVLHLPAGPGNYLLSAHAPGHGPARLEATRPQGEAETAVELRLASGVSLRGRTVAEGREEPIPLATLTLRPYPGTPTAWATATALPEEAAETTSDALGRFAFSHLAPGRYELTAEAPGFSRRTLRLLQVPQAGDVVVGLWGASTLEGFVVDARGQPVTDAEVTASGASSPVRTTTGEGGGFALEVNAGTWVVAARRGQQMGRVSGPVSVAPGETLRGLRVTLGAASGMAGTVSTLDGVPVPDAVLVATPSGGEGELGRATSKEHGAWRLDVPPGEYDVTVHAAGMTGRLLEGLVVEAGGHTPVDVRLEPATATLEGLVVNAEGQPVEGAQVRAEPRSLSGITHTVLTDAQGAWRLEGLEAGPTSVGARREGSQRWASRMETLKAAQVTHVDFTLADSGSVWGQVTRASGGALTEPALIHAVPRGGSGAASTETDAQGRFQLELPAGVYQLVALPHSTPAIYFHLESDPSVSVPEGGTVRQDLVLKEDAVLSGVVLEPSGVPSPLAIVAALQGGDFPMTRTERADETGRFSMPPRPQGASPLELVAHNAGRVGRLSGAHESQAPLTLRLEPAATLRGRVVAGNGAPPDGFLLELREANGEELPWAGAWPTTRRFPGSTFAMPDAPAQALKVTVRTDDGRTGEVQVSLRPGATSDVEIPLTGGVASIAGRAVWSRNGGPAAGVAVFLDKAVGPRPDALTGPDGRFRLSDVRPGAHTVRLLPPEGRVETRTVKVAEAEATDVGDVTVSPRRATPGTLGAGFSEDRGHVAFAWLTPDGPAARAGVHVGDRLVAVDGQVVRDSTEAEVRTRGAPGTPVRLHVRRAGGEEEVLVTRAE
ncbi:hypothetical protein A176_000126 [Myxococcus hansupus]|uniref:PDZ domain-containing protein n=1 Tax=Pseudomyxococcus hansupus TaxID=1297742 RepID=A0A0H4WKF4_9BACT|nr:carboxypeptidase regulatory-like domain-containing protein [Myxococcus hansupus]AKQ63214.1 hypothetical protein A176_000126 [Myxococcus hansupus]